MCSVERGLKREMGSSGVVVSASPLSCICWDSHHHSRILLPSSCMGILQSPHFEHSIQQQLLNSNLFNRLWKSQLFSSAAAGDWVLRSSRQSPSCTSCSYIIVPRRERKRKTRTTTSSTRRRRAACFSSACAASGSQGRNEDGGANDDLAECVEIAADGTRYLHVMASSMHNVDHGEFHVVSLCFFLQLNAEMQGLWVLCSLGGLLVAHLLPPKRLGSKLRLMLQQGFCIMQLVVGCCCCTLQ